MNIKLRKLEIEDTTLFYKWWNDDELRSLTSDNYEKMSEGDIDKSIFDHLQDKSYYDFIITDDEKPVGHILIKKDKKAKYYNLYVAIGEKDYWNRGVGSVAIQMAIKWFVQTFPSEDILELEVNQDNPRAIRCYEKVGFKKVGEKRYKHNKDTYVMQISRVKSEI